MSSCEGRASKLARDFAIVLFPDPEGPASNAGCSPKAISFKNFACRSGKSRSNPTEGRAMRYCLASAPTKLGAASSRSSLIDAL
ncbi:hypothetical protein D3C72_1827630 [compost metagenome]